MKAQAVDIALQTRVVRHERVQPPEGLFCIPLLMFCQLKISLDDLLKARGTCDPLSVAMIADKSAVKTDAVDSY